MHLLAIDTSSNACSVALFSHGELIEKFQLTPQKHLEFLLPMVEEVLAEANIKLTDLHALAIGAGPGAFAGLRIACSFAQGIALSLNLPIAAVSTLEALALNVATQYPDHLIFASLDARQNEIYGGIYQTEAGKLKKIHTADRVINEAQIYDFLLPFKEQAEKFIVIGNTQAIFEKWTLPFTLNTDFNNALPRAGEIALLGVRDFEKNYLFSAETVQPIYLRENVALNLEEQAQLRATIAAQKNQ